MCCLFDCYKTKGGIKIIKVQFIKTVDNLNYVIGEKVFDITTKKEIIDSFITNTLQVYRSTMGGKFSYIIMKKQGDGWIIPINPKTLNNEIEIVESN